MFDKRLLIVPALVVSTVAVGTIYLSSDKNTSQLSVSADPNSYSVTIDIDHPLYATNYGDTYAFELHGGGAYSALRNPDGGTLSIDLPKEKKDKGYLFSWFATDSKTFKMYIQNWSMDCEVKSVARTLWGFPSASKIQLVYNDDGKNLSVNTRPIGNWGDKTETVDPVTGDHTITYTDTNAPGDNSYWTTSIATSGGGTIYVRSMTIWYTC